VLFSEGQSEAVITLSVVADGVPEGREHVTVALMDVTTVGLEEPAQAATIAPRRAHALLTILANGSPYGVIGWHMDSLFARVQEPTGETRPPPAPLLCSCLGRPLGWRELGHDVITALGRYIGAICGVSRYWAAVERQSVRTARVFATAALKTNETF
jgi:hypothetical protein